MWQVCLFKYMHYDLIPVHLETLLGVIAWFLCVEPAYHFFTKMPNFCKQIFWISENRTRLDGTKTAVWESQLLPPWDISAPSRCWELESNCVTKANVESHGSDRLVEPMPLPRLYATHAHVPWRGPHFQSFLEPGRKTFAANRARGRGTYTVQADSEKQEHTKIPRQRTFVHNKCQIR